MFFNIFAEILLQGLNYNVIQLANIFSGSLSFVACAPALALSVGGASRVALLETNLSSERKRRTTDTPRIGEGSGNYVQVNNSQRCSITRNSNSRQLINYLLGQEDQISHV